MGIFEYIDGSAACAVELETELTKRPAISPDSNGEGELDKCIFLEQWLRDQGFHDLERFDAPDLRAKCGIRPSLMLTLPGPEGPDRLWIISHLDVVPPGELRLWKSDPWQVIQKNGVLTGRGVEDNQQGLTASVLAALSLLKNNVAPARTVKLLFAADEENGSEYGIDWILENRDIFRKGDMILVPDGGDSKGETIEIAEKNILWIEFLTTGLQSHGSRPDQGINAHLAGADLLLRLHNELTRAFPDHDPLFEPDRSTFEPTKKNANVPNVNTIPGEDSFCYDMRILPKYPIAQVMTEIERIKSEVASQYHVTISHFIHQSKESRSTPPDAPIVRLLSQAIRDVYRLEPRCIGIGGGTVGASFRNAGIDAAVWSRIDDVAHQPNEYAKIENILGDAKVMARLML
ncbi:acetylornithine deacetylase [Spirochaetia bacterium]|nr:acetylornithine deacetylase [Spirochaetia bacterium]GHU35695.1 acetylornithine deacetylase [Spirochaetia bacterium]